MKTTFDRYVCEQCKKELSAEKGLFGNSPLSHWIEVHATFGLETPWEYTPTLDFCSWMCCRDFCVGMIKNPKKDID